MSVQLWRFILRVASLCLVCGSALAQAPPSDGPWSGQVVCQLNLQSEGYTRQETQTWTMAGGTPRIQGAFRLFSVTWTATGSGSVQRTQNGQTITAQWILNPAPSNGTFAVFVRASDNRLIFRPWHTRLRADFALRGTRQSAGNGSQQPASSMAYPTWEWQLPWMDADLTSSNVSGSFTVTAEALTAELASPPGLPRIANCTWQFSSSANPVTTPATGSVSNSGSNTQNPTQTPPPGNQNPNAATQSPQNNASGNAATNNSMGTNNATGSGAAESSSNTNAGSGTTAGAPNSIAPDSFEPNDSLAAATNVGIIRPGNAVMLSANLHIASDRDFYQFTVPANGQANVVLTAGAAAGVVATDFALNQYRSDFSLVASASTGKGTSVSLSAAPGNTDTTMIVEVQANSWSAAGPSYTLNFSGIPISGTPNNQPPSGSNPGSATSVPLNTTARLKTPQMTAANPTQPQITQAAPATAASNQQNFPVTLTGKGTHFTNHVSVASFSSPQTTMAALSTSAASHRQIVQATNLRSGGGSSNTASSSKAGGGGGGDSSTASSANLTGGAGDGGADTGSASNTGSGSVANSGPAGNAAPSLQVTRLDVLSNTSAVAYLNIDPSAFGPYQITVTTGGEVAQMSNGFSVSSSATASGSTSQTAPRASGNYLVTITGLVCNTALTRSDAAYASAFIAQYDRPSGNVKMFTNAGTWVYGDVNGMESQRKQAGNRSPTGGIGNGDVIPNGFIPGIRVTLPPQANLFPLKVWQGQLTNGVDAVLISPNVWEDYGGDRSLLNTMMGNQASMMNSTLLDNTVQNEINTQTLGPLFLGPSANAPGSFVQSTATGAAQLAVGTSITPIISGSLIPPFWLLMNFNGPNKDRPIGLADGSSDPSPATIVPDATLVLTREIIEKRLGNGSWTVVPFDFKDTAHSLTGMFGADTKGEYTLFVQIERQ